MSEPAHEQQLVQVPAVLTLEYADLLKMVGYLTLEEAAEYARLSLSTVQRAARHCLLKVVGEPGEFRRTKREWVDEWLERCAQEPDEVGE